MIYPIQQAIGRNQVLHYACQLAVDTAMRRLHDGPDEWEPEDPPDDLDNFVTEHPARDFGPALVSILRAEAAARFHRRMKTDPTRCRWCGVAAREARAELEETDDG